MAGESLKVGVHVTTTGADLRALRVWDAQAMAGLCAWSTTTIVERTTQQGVGADGARFRAYSRRGPIWISLKSETARRLKPKGGTKSRSGKSIGFASYADYKVKSRKGGIVSAEVDLTLSGQLMRAVGPTQKATATLGVVGIRGQARDYGVHVNALRPYIGHHPGEKADMDAEVAALHQQAVARGQGRRSGPSAKPVM